MDFEPAAELPADAIAFLQRDYEWKVKFLTDHFGRMWTRRYRVGDKLFPAVHVSSNHDVVGEVANANVPPRPYQWRFDLISTTKLAAWFPLLLFVIWASLLFRVSQH